MKGTNSCSSGGLRFRLLGDCFLAWNIDVLLLFSSLNVDLIIWKSIKNNRIRTLEAGFLEPARDEGFFEAGLADAFDGGFA